jgi:predicted aminopeptidase
MLFKQMIDFQKATFDNSFKAMTTLQEQGEKMVKMFLEQASWLPEEGKKAVTNWIETYRKGRADFRNSVEENFDKVQNYFTGSESSPE